jgi:hypothetical protein
MEQRSGNNILSPSVTANFERRKVYQYVVTLKNNHARYVNFFSVFLLMVSAGIFLVEQWLNPSRNKIYLFCPALIILLLFYNLYRWRQERLSGAYKTALFMAAIGWATMPYFNWLFLPFVALALLEKGARLPLEIGFANNKIVVNTLIRRSYEWNDFNNIILKDNLLTLDFKTNRLLQRETVDEEGDAEEDEFNEFCQQQLNAHSTF